MVTAASHTDSYWNALARAYSQTGPPLRPSEEEILTLEREVRRYAALQPSGARLTVVLLGATPGIVSAKWPENTVLFSVDHAFSVFQSVWPGNADGIRHAICSDWLASPLADGCCDLVIGDGSINFVSYPDGCRRFAAAAARLLRPDGLFLLRSFVQIDPKESPERVIDSLDHDENASFHHFKFRLLLALQENARDGIRVADVYNYWTVAAIDAERLAAARNWSLATIKTLDFYRSAPNTLTFPTLAECREVLGEHFDEISCTSASYSLAERCPFMVLKPRPLHRSVRSG